MTIGHTAERLGVSVAHRDLDLVRSATLVAVALQYAYVFEFNYAPESIRTAFAGTLLAIHVALAAAALGQRPQTWQAAILLSIAMTIVCWLVTHGIHTGSTQFDTVEALRILAIYVMPIWLLTFPEAVPHRLLMVLAVGSTVVGGILALSGPPVYLNATRPSLATFTAGPTMIHASALFIASQLILINEYRRARMLPGRFAWPTMLFALLILNGYTGRNEMAYVGAYFAVLGYFRFRHVPAVKWSLPILLVAFVIASAFALSFVQDIQSWGSGRIGTWQYRLGIIWSRDFLTFLFGGGMRSDWIWSPQWWFFFEAVQNAHNDYLHIMMESGLLGLIATLVFLAALLMQLPGDSKSTLIALAVTSFFANTYFQSPLIAMNLLMPAPVALYCWHLRHGQGRRDAP